MDCIVYYWETAWSEKTFLRDDSAHSIQEQLRDLPKEHVWFHSVGLTTLQTFKFPARQKALVWKAVFCFSPQIKCYPM